MQKHEALGLLALNSDSLCLAARQFPALPYFRGCTAEQHGACSVYQEIWKSGKLYEYPVANLDSVKSAAGPLSDGWGLTTDQTSLIMSDGSSTLSWVDPQSLAVQRTIAVSADTACPAV